MEKVRGRLLVVDNHPADRELLARACERLGFAVAEAGSGAAALERIEQQDFDLVLLDVTMPDLDGLQVLRRIRERHTAEALPVVMVTAKAESEDVLAALELGANDYLSKPLDLIVVRARVAAQIARKRADDRSRQTQRDLEEAVARLEQAIAATEAANKAKSEFLANMSHEIRTPLNGVVGMAEMLARSALKDREREMVEIIRTSGHSLDRLLSDILDLSRVEAGQLHITVEPLHLGETVRAVAALCRLRADEKGVTLTVEIAEAADRWFVGDVTRIRQIVTNLLSNAVKFTAHGQVTVSATLGASGHLKLSVTDTGVGFDPACKDQVFGRFQQADGSITRRFGGTGLGLAISRQLAELMGGQLDCSSQPGVGSVFWADLPLEACDAPATAERENASTALERTVRILMAEDHPTNRKVAELVLLDADVDLLTVENGQEAVDLFRRESFDLVLMDMQMPVMDGLTATRLIRAHEQESGGARTPVLMLTASALPEHVQASLAAGADGHVAKPFSPVRLLAAIGEALEGCRTDIAA
jgi:signal transduction histidine kinase